MFVLPRLAALNRGGEMGLSEFSILSPVVFI
jgi:hypothetical protein